MDLPAAKNAYLLIKARIVRGLSIGFDSVKDSVEDGVRLLKEIRLWEGSIVTFPMNEAAIITSVKARREAKADFDTEFAEIQLQDAMYQMWIALRSALCLDPLVGDGARREDRRIRRQYRAVHRRIHGVHPGLYRLARG